MNVARVYHQEIISFSLLLKGQYRSSVQGENFLFWQTTTNNRHKAFLPKKYRWHKSRGQNALASAKKSV